MDLDKLTEWLLTFPGWQSLPADILPPKPGGGIFPEGVTELWRKEDLLGRTRTRLRYRFRLTRNALFDQTENARWLLSFQNWVRAQSLGGMAPEFGEAQTIRAEEGRLERREQTGLGVYTLRLTVEFTCLS